MNHLIDSQAQAAIAARIDAAVREVLPELIAQGGEEGLTAALGTALKRRSFRLGDLQVDFRYRQHSRITEEPNSGADGGFLVRVVTPGGTVEKATLFQAKLLSGGGDIRALAMTQKDADRLKKQSNDMLGHTPEAVALFYTWKNFYVVDAGDYASGPSSRIPLSREHRLITLGTYLGRWMPRCTKGDKDDDLRVRVKHLEGFKHGLSLDVISQRPGVEWEPDSQEDAWRKFRDRPRQ